MLKESRFYHARRRPCFHSTFSRALAGKSASSASGTVCENRYCASA